MIDKLFGKSESFSCVALFFYTNSSFVIFESIIRISIIGASVESFKSFCSSKSVVTGDPIVSAFSQMLIDINGGILNE
jgi:hypothetical protein